MRAFVRLMLVALTALPLLPGAAVAEPAGQFAAESADPEYRPPAAVITYRDGRMQALVGELERSSPTVARMLRAIRDYGVPVVFGTTESVLLDVQAEHEDYDPFRKKALGFMAPTVRAVPGTGRLATFTMVVGLDLHRVDELFQIARRIPRPASYGWAEIQRLETLALLGHEIVHAYGLVLANGDPRQGCLDPAEDEPPRLSCVVLGENLIRREIGAPLDWGYGLAPLAELPERYEALSERRAALRRIAAVATGTLRELPSVTAPEG